MPKPINMAEVNTITMIRRVVSRGHRMDTSSDEAESGKPIIIPDQGRSCCPIWSKLRVAGERLESGWKILYNGTIQWVDQES